VTKNVIEHVMILESSGPEELLE